MDNSYQGIYAGKYMLNFWKNYKRIKYLLAKYCVN